MLLFSFPFLFETKKNKQNRRTSFSVPNRNGGNAARFRFALNRKKLSETGAP
jgi:hypothetical protein